MQKIIAQNKDHLIKLIQEECKNNSSTCSLNHIDISLVNDLSNLFASSKFNGDISQWDVSHVKNMSRMFHNSEFNGDISKWNVSQVEIMNNMFAFSIFNRDISSWDVSKAINMKSMFIHSKFNGDLTEWKPYSVTNSENMFEDCPALIPYWAECKDNTTTNHAIENYILYSKLNKKIENKESSTKNKNKI